jgi:DNA-binding FadR family transcriptional regulator
MHSAGEHRPLLASITAGDRATAETLMRQHLAHVPDDGSAPSTGQASPAKPAKPTSPSTPTSG